MITDRMDLLSPYLDQFTRPFTVLDLGSGTSLEMSRAIAGRYPLSTIVSIEKDITADHVTELSDRVLVIPRGIGSGDLELLASSEHFDVVLVLNFLHWREDWRYMLKVLRTMGLMMFLQVPSIEDVGACGSDRVRDIYCEELERWNSYNYIGSSVQFPRHLERPIYYVPQSLPSVYPHLTRTGLTGQYGSADTYIIGDYNTVTASVRGGGTTPVWHPGMNLRNYLSWGGIHPTRNWIVERLRKYPMPAVNHGDIRVHNFIIGGGGLQLIDGYDDWGVGVPDSENMERTIQEVWTAEVLP